MRYIFIFLLVCSSFSIIAQDSLSFTRTETIYGRKDGMALTMLELKPKGKLNGKAVVCVVSGSWISSYRMTEGPQPRMQVYTDRGYIVFAVMVGSQPQYTVPAQISDLKRAVRFIRYNAAQYGIDKDHIGITGFSSGGHLALMIATADDIPDQRSFDPVDKVSARVQAAAVFAPPTDFINYGKQATTATINQAQLVISRVASAFDFKVWNDTTKTFVVITDTEKRLQIAREISPVNNVSSDDPPVLIIHGDKDPRVPLQQSELMMARLKEANVTSNLIIKEGAGHGWRNMEVDERNFADWFDKYLK